MVRRTRIGFTTGSGKSYRPLRAGPLKLRNVNLVTGFIIIDKEAVAIEYNFLSPRPMALPRTFLNMSP